MRFSRSACSAVVLALAAALAGCSGGKGGGPAHPPGASAPAGSLPTSPAPQDDGTAKAMDSYLRGLAKKKRFTGSAVVIRHGTVLARYAAGDADERKNVANTPGTIFRLASVSKQFTAMMVLKLRDDGKLKLGDRVCSYVVPGYVKSCPKAWKPITIRQILTHTSGIPDISEMSDFFTKLDQPTTTKEIISRFSGKQLDFAPGKGWKYSNSGYILAGAIIEKVTGGSYGDALRSLITQPLGLAKTGFSPGQPPAGYAKGYAKTGTPAGVINGSQANAAGGVYTTADDLARWDRSFGAHLVAPPATVREAFSPQAKCPSGGCLGDPSRAYAYGWLVDRISGHTMYYHPGLLSGFHTSNGYLPDQDVAVVVLSNVENTDVNGILRHLAGLAVKG